MIRNTLLAAMVVLAAVGIAEAKRVAPKDVTPVTKDGVTYTAPHDPMGCVVAKNAKGDTIWFRQVYVVKFNPDLEKDVQDCFITELKVDGGKLTVTNEAGGQFDVDLDSLAVKVLKGSGVIDRTLKGK
jgi:curli biogenesis system outer membrane secretion channel CsgG